MLPLRSTGVYKGSSTREEDAKMATLELLPLEPLQATMNYDDTGHSSVMQKGSHKTINHLI